MYRIFINENVLILSTSETILKKEESIEVIHYTNTISLDIAINRASNHPVHLIGADLDLMWEDFCCRFKLIEAAGGLILNDVGGILWIYRNGRWDLPKGKIEPNESIPNAAIREVREECSISAVCLGPFLGITYHTYTHKGVNFLKSSHWYLMTCNQKQVLKPQLEEGITKVVWADTAQHKKYIRNTYSSIAELLNRENVQHFLDF